MASEAMEELETFVMSVEPLHIRAQAFQIWLRRWVENCSVTTLIDESTLLALKDDPTRYLKHVERSAEGRLGTLAATTKGAAERRELPREFNGTKVIKHVLTVIRAEPKE